MSEVVCTAIVFPMGILDRADTPALIESSQDSR